MQAQLTGRMALEETARQSNAQRERAERYLWMVAERVGLAAQDGDDIAVELRAWQAERKAHLEQQEAAGRAWSELQALLDGSTLDELEANVARRRALALERAEGLDPSELQLDSVGDLDRRIQELRRADIEAAAEATRANGEAASRSRSLVSVAEAEEVLAAARVELERVRALDETLTETLRFLDAAQQRVHRDIAPVLANAVRRWLPRVTSGRYGDVRVDPQTLKVSVLGPDGRWRDAALLSRGTAEQIYLLLRVALAEHLTRDGEVCPLILDDVTVQCDDERTLAVLDTLHALGRERQVILFSQERAVLAWAQVNLREPRDRVIVLERLDSAGIVAA
jgi:DNA repair exonuclease SbcCD ATPase subunit